MNSESRKDGDCFSCIFFFFTVIPTVATCLKEIGTFLDSIFLISNTLMIVHLNDVLQL